MFTYVVFFILLNTGEWHQAFALKYSEASAQVCEVWKTDKNRTCYRMSEL